MKIAIAGKGGAGKTSIAGTLARHIAAAGHRVIALDNDLNPNLSLTLGIDAGVMTDLPTLPRNVAVKLGPGRHELTMTFDEIRDACALEAPDDITLIVAAQPRTAGTGCFGIMHKAMRHVLRVAGEDPANVCILDTESSTEHLCIGTAKYADAMYAVVEPYFTSLETGRRIALLARDLGIPRVGMIANQVRTPLELDGVRTFAATHGIELTGWVPFDACFADAERAMLAPIDYAPDAKAIEAIRALAETLVRDHMADRMSVVRPLAWPSTVRS